jgi:hypothetical protein
MKKLLAVLLELTAAFTMLPFPAAANAAFTPITGWDMMEKLGMGINIGNCNYEVDIA